MNKWEKVEQDHGNHIERMRVPWGWLVMSQDDVLTQMHDRLNYGHEWRSSITFVFDPFHRWKIK